MSNFFERPRETPESISKQSSEKHEEIKLRFPEIYHSPEWKDLDSIDRAQLLLVAEGVKPGTIIGGNFTSFQKVIEKMGLVTHLNTEPNQLEPVYEVATPAVMERYNREQIAEPENALAGEGHRVTGRFLGFPSCCTEEYINPTKNREAINKEYGAGEWIELGKHKVLKVMPNLEYEVKELLKEGKPYPDELDYRPPSFTPCSATCPNVLATLGKWKQVLEYADPEAARDLQLFHWQDETYRSFHKEEVEELEKDAIMREKLRLLRKSAGIEE